MHEDHRLLPGPQRGGALIVRDLRHEHLPFHRVTLRDAHEHLRQRNRPEALVKDEETGVRHAEEFGHVRGVREGGGEPDDSDHALRGLHLPVRARYERLNHRAALVVQQVHLVYDEQPQRRRHAHLPALARDHVPLLRRRHDHVRLLHLLLRQLRVSGQLPHLDTQRCQPAAKRARHLRGERLHRRNVNNLKVGAVRQLPKLDMRGDLVEHGHHRDVGLTGARRRAHQQVLV